MFTTTGRMTADRADARAGEEGNEREKSARPSSAMHGMLAHYPEHHTNFQRASTTEKQSREHHR